MGENQAWAFSVLYFDGVALETFCGCGKLSPKILLVKLEARLSLQYNLGRAETWRMIEGPVCILRRAAGEEGELVSLGPAR